MGEARSGGGQHFPVGSIVEVVEKDAGVRLVCTVIPLPRNIEPEENEGKIYVRYRALPPRRGRRLREFVDLTSVRPTPPPQKASKRFEVNDVVEAYYKGGWWEGVVSDSAVLAGGEKRLVVAFETPPGLTSSALGPLSLRPRLD
ncbi:hypothetical protein SASPL_139076 [Salvia splendens]|uniref:Agenet-like domain-containing protein n=1 Tax=Salvia splendens TaxID=180675 RepID=A0A8X8WW98_SALSN|nr:hypothetical protein SASPL_139076 [Salvia splendens]